MPTLQGILDLSRQIISFVGITPDGPPDVRYYPTQDGKGGEEVIITVMAGIIAIFLLNAAPRLWLTGQ
ncbi:MAG: hypothetical protein KKD99_05595 [Proteobacteria bacterium]|nr:hypothetical protein [Pseudomonadota bacterium]MBU4448041.1 hypothetical protein [Pseudomonadota bacterium]